MKIYQGERVLHTLAECPNVPLGKLCLSRRRRSGVGRDLDLCQSARPGNGPSIAGAGDRKIISILHKCMPANDRLSHLQKRQVQAGKDSLHSTRAPPFGNSNGTNQVSTQEGAIYDGLSYNGFPGSQYWQQKMWATSQSDLVQHSTRRWYPRGLPTGKKEAISCAGHIRTLAVSNI